MKINKMKEEKTAKLIEIGSYVLGILSLGIGYIFKFFPINNSEVSELESTMMIGLGMVIILFSYRIAILEKKLFNYTKNQKR
jgi:hypothetical protein